MKIYGAKVDDVVAELLIIINRLNKKEDKNARNEMAFNDLLRLTDRLRPEATSIATEQQQVLQAIHGQTKIQAIQTIRAMLGIGLREAADYYDRLP